MNSKHSRRKPMRSPCEELGPDDGVDPRTFFHPSSRKKTNRKALQLCAQVAQTLGAVLAWESGDEVLGSLTVDSVVPAPDATRLLVTVALCAAPGTCDLSQVLEHLYRASGKLRAEIAGAVHRKRVPELAFRVLPGEEVAPG